MLFDDDKDYVVGIHLPSLLNESLDVKDEMENFTRSQAKRLRLDNLPCKMNHATRGECLIGTVLASASNGPTGRVLIELDPIGHPYAEYSSKSIAAGHYQGLSLGHGYQKRFNSLGATVVRKQAREVSVCKKGLRPGSDIEGYFPSRRTLTLLDEADLHAMVKRFGYGANLERPITAANREQYIDELHALVKQRRDPFIASKNLVAQPAQAASPPDYSTAPVYMSESAVDPQSTPELAAEVMSDAAAQAKPLVENDPPAASAVDATMASPERDMANEMLEMKRQMAEMQEERVALLTKNKERDDADAQRKQAANEALMDDAKRALTSFFQDAQSHNTPETSLSAQLSDFNEDIANDPEKAIKRIHRATEMMQCAANTQRAQNEATLQKARQQMKNEDTNYFRQALPQLSAFDQRLKAAQEAERNLNATRHVPAAIPAPQMSAPMTGVVNASTNSAAAPVSVDRRSLMDEYSHQCAQSGRMSSYTQVRDLQYTDQTGEVRASANGFQPDRVIARGQYAPGVQGQDYSLAQWNPPAYDQWMGTMQAQRNRAVIITPE